ncbi:MAG: translational GTPase TypA [Candidatus Elulimicrobiales bacterium]|nr:translational GTPase TypA [Candidatus Elulimicrobiales bacterium]
MNEEYKEIRNIAIIAHVDHGKTTLTDALMKECGVLEEGFSMDTNDLEKERGITIYAKNTSVIYKGTKINILDTPGHADFGSEVERVLRSIDSVLLLVDAQEGPMPQTRFVLKKSLELGLKPIVVINKIDKPASDVKRVHDEVFELFLELGADDEQLDFTTVYAIGRQGVAMKELGDEKVNLEPLLDTILEKVPKATGDINNSFVAQVFNLAYDNFLGRMAIARVYDGIAKVGESIFVKDPFTGNVSIGKITKIFTFYGVNKIESEFAKAGDIVMIAGFPNIFIGETFLKDQNAEGKPAIHIDEPTISLDFLVNDSPFAGREGKYVTGRQIRDRLEKELEVNVGLKVNFDTDKYLVYGRGEMHIAVLLENMRREGYELQVSQPKVIFHETKNEAGDIVKKEEPFEEVVIDVPNEFSGVVMEKLGRRKGIVTDMNERAGIARIRAEVPTRGLLGYRGEFIVDTKGLGILSSRFIKFGDFVGNIQRKLFGSMTSMESGKALGFSLFNLQDRGTLYIGPGVEVYDGQVIGNTSKGEEMVVNPTKGKQLTNMRASGSDDAITLIPAWELSIERGLEIMNEDEYLEITPKSVRLRKQILNEAMRAKANRKKEE